MFDLNANTMVLMLNVFVFLLFGVDKLWAKKKKMRIPEAVLLTLSLFFGGVGAMFGMLVFNHKTSKIKFRVLVPVFAVINYYMFRNGFGLLRYVLSIILQFIPE